MSGTIPPTPTPGSPLAPRPRLAPQAGFAAWRAADLRPTDWMIPIGAEDVAELEAALTALGGRAPVSAADAPLPRLGAVLNSAASRLDTGRGFVLLRGLPLDRFEETRQEVLLQALGAHLGRAVPQGPEGALVQRLESRAAGPLRWRFHADAADIVAMLTLRQPPDVDPVMLVAAATVHNEMLKRNRAALEVLHRPMPHAAPSQRILDLPVFSTASGAFVGRYDRDAIQAAQRSPETPRLTAAQVEALDLLDQVCAEPGLALKLEVRPGDVLLFNPLQVWKRRVEGAEPEAEPLAADVHTVTRPEPPTRQALRMLLLTENSRALPQGLLALGETLPAGPGMVGG